jgi:hypothetical protein
VTLPVFAFVLTLDLPVWLWIFDAAMVLVLGYGLLSFLVFGRKWMRTQDELVIPTLWSPNRRLAIPEEGIGIQDLPNGVVVYLGDPWDRATPRFSQNICMSSTDIREWLPHYDVATTRRPRRSS